MKNHRSSGRGTALVLQYATLVAGLLAAVGSHAAGQVAQPAARAMPVSLNTEAGTPDTPSRADLERMFKARCPGRVERLLGIALAAERPDFKAIANICTCATASVEAMPATIPLGQFQSQASQAALACSKGTITARNELRAAKALGPYLSAQGLSSQQVGLFSQCVADAHWRATVEARQNGSGQADSNWWATCTEQIGRKGLAAPQN